MLSMAAYKLKKWKAIYEITYRTIRNLGKLLLCSRNTQFYFIYEGQTEDFNALRTNRWFCDHSVRIRIHSQNFLKNFSSTKNIALGDERLSYSQKHMPLVLLLLRNKIQISHSSQSSLLMSFVWVFLPYLHNVLTSLYPSLPQAYL